jgi:hypothetical protein
LPKLIDEDCIVKTSTRIRSRERITGISKRSTR